MIISNDKKMIVMILLSCITIAGLTACSGNEVQMQDVQEASENMTADVALSGQDTVTLKQHLRYAWMRPADEIGFR